MKKYKCKYCESTNFNIRDTGKHYGLYCSICGNWHKWLSEIEYQERINNGNNNCK